MRTRLFVSRAACTSGPNRRSLGIACTMPRSKGHAARTQPYGRLLDVDGVASRPVTPPFRFLSGWTIASAHRSPNPTTGRYTRAAPPYSRSASSRACTCASGPLRWPDR